MVFEWVQSNMVDFSPDFSIAKGLPSHGITMLTIPCQEVLEALALWFYCFMIYHDSKKGSIMFYPLKL